jgi:hypothetical protein
MALALVSVGQSLEYEDDGFFFLLYFLACRSVFSFSAFLILLSHCFFPRLLAIISQSFSASRTYLLPSVSVIFLIRSLPSLPSIHCFLSLPLLYPLHYVAVDIVLPTSLFLSDIKNVVNLKLDR